MSRIEHPVQLVVHLDQITFSKACGLDGIHKLDLLFLGYDCRDADERRNRTIGAQSYQHSISGSLLDVGLRTAVGQHWAEVTTGMGGLGHRDLLRGP